MELERGRQLDRRARRIGTRHQDAAKRQTKSRHLYRQQDLLKKQERLELGDRRNQQKERRHSGRLTVPHHPKQQHDPAYRDRQDQPK